MNDLKPFAFISDRARDDFASPAMVACCPYETAEMRSALYAIPSTHRVVSVELLQFAFNCMEIYNHTEPEFPNYKAASELRAIIDNKAPVRADFPPTAAHPIDTEGGTHD